MNEHELVIRAAQPGDADAVFALLTAFATSYEPQRAAFDRIYPRLLDAEHADMLVAARNGRVIGYALAFRLLTLYANGFVTELQELMVDPAHRSRGVGTSLVEAISARAREAGSAEMTVPTRRAGDYYRKLGFTETASYFKRKWEI